MRFEDMRVKEIKLASATRPISRTGREKIAVRTSSGSIFWAGSGMIPGISGL